MSPRCVQRSLVSERSGSNDAGRSVNVHKVLVVVAHPDDEVLGCGGTIAVLARQGVQVQSVFVSGTADARSDHPGFAVLRASALRAQAVLAADEPVFGPFPNIRLNTVPHLELVQFIEQAMTDAGADVLITHHPSDLNDDHRQVSSACQAAARLAQRRDQDCPPPLAALLYCEVLSATDWSFPNAFAAFAPSAYTEIGEEGLGAKLAALAEYEGVLRRYPHPRSVESVRALATLRGSEAGLQLAEAFQVAFMRWGA
jgi:LmbE family N-acetylglucosaminyl deacetylase